MIHLKKLAIYIQPIVVVDNLTKEKKIPISFLDIHVTNVGQQETNVHVDEEIHYHMIQHHLNPQLLL